MGKIKHGRYKASEDLMDHLYTRRPVVDIYAKSWDFADDTYHGKRCPKCKAWYDEEEGESCDCEQGYSFDRKKRR